MQAGKGDRNMDFMDAVHGALDVGGFIPGIGALSDGINAGLYAAEGDWGNAALSLAAAVPGPGDVLAITGKTAIAAGKVAKTVKTAKTAKTVKAAKSSKALSKVKNICSVVKKAAGKVKVGAKKTVDRVSKATDFTKQKNNNKQKCKKAGSCFTGDMLVCIENGYCFIKDIQNGDDIYTRNAKTGETGFQKVYNVVQSEAHTIHHIWLDGKEEIKTTAYHPFYVKKKGWVNAINLKEGDLLETTMGEVPVTKISKTRHEEPKKVYNFQVEEWESYFVSGMQVYVHNGNPCNQGKKGYQFKPGIDVDLRGKGTVDDAKEEAFKRLEQLGEPRDSFTVSEWSEIKNEYGKSVPVEWTNGNGAEVSIDLAHTNKDAPAIPHVGYKSGGKRTKGGKVVGHIFVDKVTYHRKGKK